MRKPIRRSGQNGLGRAQELLLVGVALLALSLRIWGIGVGLPYLYHPDEAEKVRIAQGMVKTGDLNPHYFLKPGLFIYLNALAYVPYYLVGRLLGVFHRRADMVRTFTDGGYEVRIYWVSRRSRS